MFHAYIVEVNVNSVYYIFWGNLLFTSHIHLLVGMQIIWNNEALQYFSIQILETFNDKISQIIKSCSCISTFIINLASRKQSLAIEFWREKSNVIFYVINIM